MITPSRCSTKSTRTPSAWSPSWARRSPGELEPIAGICAALDQLAKKKGADIVPVHVDAASGGFVVPFLHPDLVWDFRLPRVVSINVSGHKYGLTYPGIGFVVWRNAEQLPEDLVFRVNYLGGDMPTFTLNFSRPGNQVVGQYYNFLRLGREGYTTVMRCLSDTAQWLAHQLADMTGNDGTSRFQVISDGSAIPVVSFRLAGDPGYTVFDISALLRSYGWQVPAYTMPDDAADVAVLRIVVRARDSRPTWPARCRTTWSKCSANWTDCPSAGSPPRSISPTGAPTWDTVRR